MLKEIHEQPEALENALRGRLEESDGTRPFRRPQPRSAAAAASRSHGHDGVRHQLSCGPGRRISVRGVRPHAGRGGVRLASFAIAIRRWTATPSLLAHDAIRRNGRHPGGAARIEAQGSSDAGALQRRRQQHRPRSRRRRLSARRPGDRRRQHQGVYAIRSAVLAMLALYFGRMRHLSSMQGSQMVRDLRAVPGPAAARRWPASRRCEKIAAKYQHASNCPLPRPAVPLPGRAGRRIEAKGNQLYPRRGLSGGGDETWPDRAGGRKNADRSSWCRAARSSTRC